MSTKSLVMLGMIIGSTVGGFIPTLWGAGYLSYSSLIGSTLGGFLGIYISIKLTSDA